MISFDRRMIRFGKGDIEIAYGTTEQNEGFLLFSNLDHPQPIGEISSPKDGRADRHILQDDDIMMTFSVINCLNKINKWAFTELLKPAFLHTGGWP